MKFTVHRSAFLDKLVPAMGTVSARNTISSIEGVLIETLEGRLRISTFDMNKGVRAMIDPIEIEEEGSVIINAQRLYQTVRVMPDGEMTVMVDEGFNCTISCGRSTFHMGAMDGKDFPSLPELQSERGYVLSAPLFKSMIGRVIHSVSEDSSRPMLCGVFFEFSKGQLRAVSCDSYTLSICTERCEVERTGAEAKEEVKFLLPGHALGELGKILGDGEEDKVLMYLSRKHAIFRGEDIIFFTRTLDMDYIDYNRILPKENDIFVTVERERLLEGLERANIIAEEKIQGSAKSYVKLHVGAPVLSLTSTSVNGRVYDEMECEIEGGDLDIGFNCRYLINCVRAARAEQLVLSFKGPTQAVTMKPKTPDENSDFFYMVLPVRMNEA